MKAVSDDALKELLGFRSELLGFIRAILRNPADAEDLFQETCRIILEKSRELPDIVDFRAWAKEIARRQVLQHYRTLRTRKTSTVPSEEMAELASDVYRKQAPTPEELAEESAALRACLDRMPERQRHLIRLRFIAGQGYDSIARAIQGSEGSIRRMVARTRLLLMECVRRRLGLAGRGN
jgi:RNA polymerase sigma-70 factor (ECF subfamily)